MKIYRTKFRLMEGIGTGPLHSTVKKNLDFESESAILHFSIPTQQYLAAFCLDPHVVALIASFCGQRPAARVPLARFASDCQRRHHRRAERRPPPRSRAPLLLRHRRVV